jgi:ribosome-binding factor A
MSGKRTARLNEQFKREISEILRREVQDPRIGLPTVTAVEASPDLWTAKIYVRLSPGEKGDERAAEMLVGLKAASPFIRRMLGERLDLRRVPELRFELDRTLDEAMRIERILQEVLPPDAGGDRSSPSGESDVVTPDRPGTEG